MSPRGRLLVAAFVLFGSATKGFAEECTSGAPADALATLTSPADEATVRRLLADPLFGPAREARCLVVALRTAGGHAAADGLRQLAGHTDPEVASSSLDALGALALRGTAIANAVRALLESRDATVRRAAVAALGSVGGGTDVPTLLDLLDSDDAPTKRAAMRSLVSLTGARLPASTTRWSQWWKATEARANEQLPAALERLAAEAQACGNVCPWRAVVHAYGWTDLELVQETVTAWLRSSSTAVRAEAFRIVASLRLADLAAEVRRSLPYVSTADECVANEAARVLGIARTLDRPSAGERGRKAGVAGR